MIFGTLLENWMYNSTPVSLTVDSLQYKVCPLKELEELKKVFQMFQTARFKKLSNIFSWSICRQNTMDLLL